MYSLSAFGGARIRGRGPSSGQCGGERAPRDTRLTWRALAPVAAGGFRSEGKSLQAGSGGGVGAGPALFFNVSYSWAPTWRQGTDVIPGAR
jgi:hypothetical protein